jgi:hypothetical protein
MEASAKDKEIVMRCYEHHPVPGYDIGRVEVIYNPVLNDSFLAHVAKLQQQYKNTAFAPKWHLKKAPEWRAKVHELFMIQSAPYGDGDYPAVKFLPLWHGTRPALLSSIFTTGYVNLATTDCGYFGKGIYGALEAEYSQRVYGKGALILNWVGIYSAYPVIAEDITFIIEPSGKKTMDVKNSKLAGKGNYANYDANFIPVVPKDPTNPREVEYYPCAPNEPHVYTEVVVFERSACLPRYHVTLQQTLLPPPSSNTSIVTAWKDYEAKSANQLSFKAGDKLTLHGKKGYWWLAEHKNNVGLIPASYVQSKSPALLLHGLFKQERKEHKLLAQAVLSFVSDMDKYLKTKTEINWDSQAASTFVGSVISAMMKGASTYNQLLERPEEYAVNSCLKDFIQTYVKDHSKLWEVKTHSEFARKLKSDLYAGKIAALAERFEIEIEIKVETPPENKNNPQTSCYQQ